MRLAGGCPFVPPHILRNIAERGEAAARRGAQLALDLASQFRAERMAVAVVAGAPTIPLRERRRTIFDARNGTDLPGRRARTENGARSADPAVNEAFDCAGLSLEFLNVAFDRHSIDGAGARIDATVHYGLRNANAIWNGRQLILGDGDGVYFKRFTSAVDVIAHELAHGMTQYTAALEYQGQAGALSEHFADVFGVLTRQYARKQNASRADWLVGAGLFTKRVNGDAVRSMKSPGSAYDDPVLGRDPQPSHINGYVRTRVDNGGVHVNSGIPNRAFYEVATLLGGKAWDVPGRIWYRTLTHRLHARATFQQCADATYETAGELFGTASAPHQAVLAAWKTVGINVSDSVLTRGPRLRLRAKKTPEPYQPPGGGAELPMDVPVLRG